MKSLEDNLSPAESPKVEIETPAYIEDARGFWPKIFTLALLVVGLAALAGCWIYGNDRGMTGGGFLAVVGAVLSLKK